MYYEFFCPVKILSGNNAIFNLPNELERLGAQRPLILTDKGIRSAGLIDSVIGKVFKESNKETPAVFDDIPVESSVKSVEKALSFFKDTGCDSIVAIGGGSVIDSSKALNMLVAQNSTNLLELTGVNVIKSKGAPFIAIPTTSGTGSEVTSVAVIFDENSNTKLAFASSCLMPDSAILDVDMVLSMPKSLTASSGIDALSHAVEAYIGIQNNPISKALALRAVQMILTNLPNAVKNGKDKRVRLNMMNASMMAGMAFSNSMVGIVHSLAHAAGAVLHIPHGVAVSLFLIAGLEENLPASSRDIAELFDAFFDIKDINLEDSDLEKSKIFIRMLEKFVNQIRDLSDIPASLNDVGLKVGQIDKIIDLAVKDGSSIFSKVPLNYETASRMIKKAMIRKS